MPRSLLATFSVASSLLVSLAACTDDPEPGTPVELVEIECGRADCESGAPLAIDATMVVQPSEPGVVARIAPKDGAVASVAVASGTTDPEWIVTGLRAGATELELRDERDRVVGTYTLEVAATEHFEATINWTLGGRVFIHEHLRSDEPHNFGQPGRLRVKVDPYAGDTALRGALTYQIGLALPAASTVLENDPSGNVFIEAQSGENRMTFTAGGRTETFRFVVF